jgi:predicted nuclease with RNAse H fold
LIYRGIEFNRRLVKRGYQVIEVYPYATKLILFGEDVPPKNSARNVVFMREELPHLINGLEAHIDSLDRNACDALVSAYTALLHSREETDVLGATEEGLLVLPKLSG